MSAIIDIKERRVIFDARQLQQSDAAETKDGGKRVMSAVTTDVTPAVVTNEPAGRKWQVFKRKYRRQCPKITCCGITFLAGNQSRHEAGRLHKMKDRLVALAAQDCISDSEIARRLGCSHQLISIYLKRLGLKPATDRKRSCSLLSTTDLWREKVNQHPLAGPFVQECERRGYEWLPVIERKELHVSRCLVNGHTVQLRRTRYHRSSGYIPLHGINRAKYSDFVAWLLADTGEWIIIPWRDCPQHQTMFSAEPDLHRSGAISCRHDWPKYINHWQQLKDLKPIRNVIDSGESTGWDVYPGASTCL